jgi:hypothetical protein
MGIARVNFWTACHFALLRKGLDSGPRAWLAGMISVRAAGDAIWQRFSHDICVVIFFDNC